MMLKSRCVLLLALCFMCVSANDDFPIENGCPMNNQSCVTHRLSTTLGSSVLLPCNFNNGSQDAVVSWIHSPAFSVVSLASGGRVTFYDPRFGRISTFPNQGSKGNYSISINNVNHTDLGCYQCLNQDHCVQVELALKPDSDNWLFPFYIYIIYAVASIFVLAVVCFICVKCFLKGNNETEENPIIVAVDAGDALSDPPQELRRVSGDGQAHNALPPSSPAYVNSIVYENDNHVEDEPDYLNEMPGHSGMNRNEASNSGYFNFERVESQRTKITFHTELMNRLRQASIRKHHYVNQDELHKRQDNGAKKKKIKRHRQYPNPIYNRSSDGLDQL